MRIREAAPVTTLPGSGLTTAPAGEGPEPVDRYSPAAESTGANLIPRPPAFAERVERIRPPEVPGQPRRVTPTYQQTSPAWVDPEGDAHLIRLLDRIPERLIGALFSHLLRGEKWDQRDGSVRPPHRVGREAPVDVQALGRDFQDLVRETGIRPTLGPEHKWSPEAKKYRRLGFWRRVGNWMRGGQDFPTPDVPASKLFLLLATGQTARFALTGKESALETALMRRPDRSVTPSDLLRESYVLNQGDLYATLLTAENVLARDPYDPRRDEQPLQRKLEYLRNDTPEVGDNFAAWYHFFGTALYALKRPAWLAQVVARTETAGSILLEGPDRQEAFINRQGAEFGSLLRRMVAEEAHLTRN
jgi:hypothetical protein